MVNSSMQFQHAHRHSRTKNDPGFDNLLGKASIEVEKKKILLGKASIEVGKKKVLLEKASIKVEKS